MPLTTRPLTRDDFDQSMALIREAFGDLPPGATPPSADDPRPGYHAFGTFDDGHLVARVATRDTTRGSAAAPYPPEASPASRWPPSGGARSCSTSCSGWSSRMASGSAGRRCRRCSAPRPGSTASSATSWSPPTTRSRSPQQRWPGSVPRPVCAPAGRRPPTSTRSARCTTPGRPRRTARSRAAARRSRPMPGRSSTRSPGSRSRSTTRATWSASRAGGAAGAPATPRRSRSST